MTLKTNKLKPKNKPLGFTIVELLVVIVVIGILATITIVSYTGITKKANESTLKSDLANSKKQFALYYTEHGVYPTGLNVNKCPTGTTNPNPDTNYCLKPTSDTIISISEADGTKYKLTATKAGLAYSITEDSTPSLSVLLPESDWITIGTQRWARKNLNVGTMITSTTFPVDDSSLEKYCYNNNEANCTTYGGMYNWNEAMGWTTTEGTRGICPVGSHIPSDDDWKVLEMQLGMTKNDADIMGDNRGTDEGDQLKSGGSSGLDIKFSGIRYGLGSFDYIDIANILITSTEDSSVNVKARQLHVNYSEVSRILGAKTTGFSVRCLGD